MVAAAIVSDLPRIAAQIGPFSIHWYGLLADAAILTGLFMTLHYAARFGIDPENILLLAPILVVAIVVGARLAHVLTMPGYYLAHPVEILRIYEGGLASHGAIAASMLVGIWAARWLHFSYWAAADAIAPALPMAHIFIRVANFINGENYGPPTHLPWGVIFPGDSVPRHPSQLYEALTSALILALAVRWARRRRFEGELFWRVMLALSLVRFLIDFIRRSGPMVGPFVLSQLAAGPLVILAALLLWRGWRRATRSSAGAARSTR